VGRAPFNIDVVKKDQRELRSLLKGGIQQVRVVLRALAWVQLAEDVSAPQIAKTIPLTPQAIRRLSHRYWKAGYGGALYEKERPGAAEVLENNQKQRIIAMVCTDPPERRARWTVRWVAEEAIKPETGSTGGKRNLRILLLHHDLKPWREKCGAWPTSMKSTSRRWRTCWKRMSGHMMRHNWWSAWTRSRSRRTPMSVRRRRPSRGAKRDGTTNMNAAARPMFSAQ
jgi:putative transposase